MSGRSNRKNELPQESLTPTTPLRLAVAARIAFPDGSMTLAGLRREISRGRLAYEVIAGKHYTTLSDIEDMRRLCRIQANAPGTESSRRARRIFAAPGVEYSGEESGQARLARLLQSRRERGKAKSDRPT